jgi:hypothetical protein
MKPLAIGFALILLSLSGTVNRATTDPVADVTGPHSIQAEQSVAMDYIPCLRPSYHAK